MVRERIAWQNPNFRVIDGTGEGVDVSKDPSHTSLVDRVMDEIGDTLPFEIIEGGRIEEAVGDRVVSGSKGMVHVVWDSSHPTENSFLDRVKKLFKKNNPQNNDTSGSVEK